MVYIDTVYQRVLAIANKEQRGYITPLEFNLLANQAQMDIFEQYFYDLNQFSKVQGNDSTYADMTDLLKEKIDIFEKYQQSLASLTAAGVGTFPTHYRMGEVYYYNTTLADNANHSGWLEMEKIDQNGAHHILNSPLTQPSVNNPIYVQLTELTFQTYPTVVGDGGVPTNIKCNYIARPATVRWGWTIVNEKPLYNASSTYTTNFELHESEETELVIKILELAGITIKKPDLYQLADKEEIETIQQEKS